MGINDYYCKDCQFFNEDTVPADCERGHGKVAYMHHVCGDFFPKEFTNNTEGLE